MTYSHANANNSVLNIQKLKFARTINIHNTHSGHVVLVAPRIGGEYNEKQQTGEMPGIDEVTSLSQSVHLRDFIHTRFLSQFTKYNAQLVYHTSS
jgi:hypothetical protein